MGRPFPADYVQTAQAGHGDVEDHHVGYQGPRGFARGDAIADLAHDVDLGRAFQEPPKSLSNGAVIFGDQHADALSHRCTRAGAKGRPQVRHYPEKCKPYASP